MLVIQHNCRKEHAIIITVLETGLALKAEIICLQEPYIGINNITHGGYTILWPETGPKDKKRVLIAIRKDLQNNLIIESKTDLINHPYALTLDIWDIHHIIRKKIRRTRLINVYDNIINIRPENWQNVG
jgi:hypothetical protein